MAPEAVCSERPLSHWGEQTGLIDQALVLDEAGDPVEVLEWGRPCRVSVSFRVPRNFDSERFAVAFSIKDLRGHDIVVSSTVDSGLQLPAHLEPGQPVTVDFEFVNGLVEGKYFLVAALER